MRRLKGRYEQHGYDDIVDQRGSLSRRRKIAMETIERICRLNREKYADEGVCDERLEAAIPSVAHWRLSALPRCLTDEQLDQMLASFDAPTPCARRDRAIVLYLSILGLRPGEVAALHLEDVDWRRGTVHLRTRKTRQGAVLPLPRDAGRAIVDYLRQERPRTGERRLFVQHLGRHRGAPVSSGVVSGTVVRALRRAGIEAPLAGAYVLRHTVASRVPLKIVYQETVATALRSQT
jgi:integrase